MRKRGDVEMGFGGKGVISDFLECLLRVGIAYERRNWSFFTINLSQGAI